jgi:hypothetical protein
MNPELVEIKELNKVVKRDMGCSELNNDKNMKRTSTSCFFSLPPKQLALLSSLIGILLIDDLDLNQQNSLGNFIVNIGQAILTAAAQGQSLQSNSSQNDNSQKDDTRQQFEILKKQICALEQELDNN